MTGPLRRLLGAEEGEISIVFALLGATVIPAAIINHEFFDTAAASILLFGGTLLTTLGLWTRVVRPIVHAARIIIDIPGRMDVIEEETRANGDRMGALEELSRANGDKVAALTERLRDERP